ncbi:uncharacterized protein BO80DRAFT_423453 [Aspergillus ibericus CBS 121593]|uniref:Uncharacterized protein n=1 Tax=Aspergillus ibericus CBS 121593 TaxID=1448316 RepID=A0A395H537_9EURO|nr:hypothetical protein BO80DRAFT_423453 [Aspergillus ibericus CBS 121593]RAL02991.1 hypothetical protein BO80DRAFT_423453 [Aspergillus ibericus CBS 121593]
MKPLNLLLLLTTLLLPTVHADNASIGYELLFYYYVYKMEYQSGAPRTIAVDCQSRDTGGGMCKFDEFVKHVIEADWYPSYEPAAADHTTTPDDSQLTRINRNIPGSARLDLGKLLNNLDPDQKAYAIIITKVLHAADAAFAADENLSTTDMAQAVAYAKEAKSVRNEVVFPIQQEALQGRVDAEVLEYVHSTLTGFDWVRTFGNIDLAVEDGSLDSDVAKGYKAQLRLFARNFQHDIYVAKEAGHLNNVRALATAVTRITRNIEDREPGATEAEIPSTECSDEFSSDETTSSSSSSGSD